jgi:acetyl-CoA synthetase
LKSVGVGKGDAVIIYLPMLLELPIAMLACARIGAVHSVTARTTSCDGYLVNPSFSFSML